MQIKIVIPVDHTTEIRYVIDLLFGDVLNLDYQVETRIAITDVVIQVGEKKLIFQDHFFSKFMDGEDFIQEKFFPPKAHMLAYADEVFPILYGHDYMYQDDRMIVCGLDVFSSLFFLLTAWEEEARKYIIEEYGHFPFNATWLWKNELHEHDFVLDYAQLIIHLLKALDYDSEIDIKQPEHNSFIVLVDDLNYFKADYKPPSSIDFLKAPKKAFQEQKVWKKYMETGKDPFDNLNECKRFAKENNLNLHYLISSQLETAEIESVDSYMSEQGLTYGVSLLNEDKMEGFEEPKEVHIQNTKMTLQEKWRFLEDRSVEKSYNALFKDFSGYRCGTSIPFNTFDTKPRRSMGLMEVPVFAKWDKDNIEDVEGEGFIQKIESVKGKRLLVSNTLVR